MNGKPDGLLLGICPSYPMPPMLFNIDVIAGIHDDVFRLIFKAKNGASLHENNPFMFILIIPETVR
jgi:hypothetical protein